MTGQDPWKERLLQKWVDYLERDTVRISIQTKVIDPLLTHVLKRVFPYIVMICVMFSLLLVSTLITLGVILFQARSVTIVGGSHLKMDSIAPIEAI